MRAVSHFHELDEYLDGKMSEDYWYDSAINICEDIIQIFSENDWIQLWSALPHKNEQWNVRLIECLGSISNLWAIKCILKLTKEESKNIFIACVDALRDVNLDSELGDIQNLVLRAKKMLELGNESKMNKMVLMAFIKSVSKS